MKYANSMNCFADPWEVTEKMMNRKKSEGIVRLKREMGQ